ncbi:MAG TPA: YbaK/EbsC family protein [Actinomycetota bacterium]|nr:YbaK/EbsC family protein [Actinomycetota bacterium]
MTAPDTPALQALAGSGLAFDVVTTERPTSVEDSAAQQGIPVSRLLKTLVVRRGPDDHIFILVPGDRSIDWAKLRKHLGVSRISLPDADAALAVTGYERGAITPFGSATPLPVIADASIAEGARVAIGGGARGVNIHALAGDLLAALGAVRADVTKLS